MLRRSGIIALYVLVVAASTYISFEWAWEGTEEVILRNSEGEITNQWTKEQGTRTDKVLMSILLSIIFTFLLSIVLLKIQEKGNNK